MDVIKKGFNKAKFEADHFTFRRGAREKHFNGWEDVQYHGGLTRYAVNKSELEKGNMGPQLYDFLCHVYGEDAMAEYFPKPEPEQARKPTLHFSPTSVMANSVGRQTVNPSDRLSHLQGKGVMNDEEIDDLATLLCGTPARLAELHRKKGII